MDARLAADLLSAFSIVALFALSHSYRRASGARALWPMDWGFDSRPLWAVRRDLALLALPVIMTATMLALALGTQTAQAGPAFALRAVPAVLGVAVHWRHLRRAAAYLPRF